MVFGFWILSFGIQVKNSALPKVQSPKSLDFRLWVIDFAFSVLDSGAWILDSGLQILHSGLGVWISDFRL